MIKNIIKKNVYHRKKIIIGLIAGEPSGDILGAGLIRSLRHYVPSIKFVGIGGKYMQKETMKSWYPIEYLSVMGIIEVIKCFPRLLYIYYKIKNQFKYIKPDVFIGIDFPDFNLLVEKYLKKHNIPTIHYVSPTVWAWRKNRIFNVKKSTHCLLSCYPFEKKIYKRYNISCEYIGHSLADKIPLYPNKISARFKLGIYIDVPCLLILLGSREHEMFRLTKDFLNTAINLKKKIKDLVILVPIVNLTLYKLFIKLKNIIAPNLSVKMFNIDNNRELYYQLIISSDIGLVASGTAVLECMLAKCPMVVGYKVHPITFLIGKFFIKIPWISLPNILARKEIVPEFLQNDCQSSNLSSSLIELLTNNKKREILLDIFLKLHKKIKCNADKKAALRILKFIK